MSTPSSSHPLQSADPADLRTSPRHTVPNDRLMSGTRDPLVDLATFSSGEEGIELDAETLDTVSRFIDMLHGPVPGGVASDLTNEGVERDSKTKDSMSKFLAALSQDREGLVNQLDQAIASASLDSAEIDVSPETLSAIGNYIDAAVLKKQNSVECSTSTNLTSSRSHDTVEEDGVKLSQNVLDSIGEFIDAAARNEEKIKENNATCCKEGIEQLLTESSAEASAVRPETLSAIGNYIDSVALRKQDYVREETELPVVDMVDAAPINPATLAVIGDYIDSVAVPQLDNTATLKAGDEESDTKTDSTDEKTMDASVAAELDQETLSTIGNFIDSIALEPQVDAKSPSSTTLAINGPTRSAETIEKAVEQILTEHFLDDAKSLVSQEDVIEQILSDHILYDAKSDTVDENGLKQVLSSHMLTGAKSVRASENAIPHAHSDPIERSRSEHIQQVKGNASPSSVCRSEPSVVFGKNISTIVSSRPISSESKGPDKGMESSCASAAQTTGSHEGGEALEILRTVSGMSTFDGDTNEKAVESARDVKRCDGNQLAEEPVRQKSPASAMKPSMAEGTMVDEKVEHDGEHSLVTRSMDGRGDQHTLVTENPEQIEALNEILSVMETSVDEVSLSSEGLGPELLSMIDAYLVKFSDAQKDDEISLLSAKCPQEQRALVSQFIDNLESMNAKEQKSAVDSLPTDDPEQNEAINEILSAMEQSCTEISSASSASPELLSMIDSYLVKFTDVQSIDEISYGSSSVPEELRAIVSQFIDAVETRKKEKEVQEFAFPEGSLVPFHLLKPLRCAGTRILPTAPRDPPTDLASVSEEDGPKLQDPPLHATLSEEENRLSCNDKPETNPRKGVHITPDPHSCTLRDLQVNNSGELLLEKSLPSISAGHTHRSVTPRQDDTHPATPDPSDLNEELVFDSSGELAVDKKVGEMPPCAANSLSHSRLNLVADDQIAFAHQEDKDPITASREVEEPELLSVNSSQSFEYIQLIDDNQNQVPTETEDPIVSSKNLKRLASMLFLCDEPSLAQRKKLAHVLCFACPFVDGKIFSANVESQLMLEAKYLDLPLEVADRFLGLTYSAFENEMLHDIQTAPSDELVALKARNQECWGVDGSNNKKTVLEFLNRLVEVGEQDPYLSRKTGENGLDLHITASGGDENEAIEVDLRDGFINKELTLAKSGQEPWWEIAARLSGENIKSDSIVGRSTTVTDGEETPRQDDCSADAPNSKSLSKNSLDYDIEHYCKSQEKGEWKRLGYPSKTIEEHGFNGTGPWDDNVWTTPSTLLQSNAPRLDSQQKLWIVRRSMGSWTKISKGKKLWRGKFKLAVADVREPKIIDAVAATARLFTVGSFRRRLKELPLVPQWKCTYKQRTEKHSGYLGVHINSLKTSCSPADHSHPLDRKPWEHRIVHQRFLHEHSVSFCRNWFGILLPARGNIAVVQPVCHVESMPMPVKAAEWTEDWYERPWMKPLDSNLSGSPAKGPAMKRSMYEQVGPYATPFMNDDDDDKDSLGDIPECGRIRNTRLKIGERISRVTPDLTSSLRRSRWRKKHFPRGSFPY